MKLSLKTGPENRRQHYRLELGAPVGLAEWRGAFGLPTRHPQFDAQTTNASLGGLELTVDRKLTPGRKVRIWIQVEVDGVEQTLKLGGVVRRAMPSGPEGKFAVGIQLLASPRAAMLIWTRAFADDLRIAKGTPIEYRGPSGGGQARKRRS